MCCTTDWIRKVQGLQVKSVRRTGHEARRIQTQSSDSEQHATYGQPPGHAGTARCRVRESMSGTCRRVPWPTIQVAECLLQQRALLATRCGKLCPTERDGRTDALRRHRVSAQSSIKPTESDRHKMHCSGTEYIRTSLSDTYRRQKGLSRTSCSKDDYDPTRDRGVGEQQRMFGRWPHGASLPGTMHGDGVHAIGHLGNDHLLCCITLQFIVGRARQKNAEGFAVAADRILQRGGGAI